MLSKVIMGKGLSIIRQNNLCPHFNNAVTGKQIHYNMQILKGWKSNWVDLKVALHIFRLAIMNYRSPGMAFSVCKGLYFFKKSVLGAVKTKIVQINNQYYHSLYAPGYPSKAFDKYIEAEFNRITPITKKTNLLTFIIFAVTKKCPLQCEHCFEWNNLNGKESFTLNELKTVVDKFQHDGISQFHLSGGEPMVRVKDLAEVIKSGGRQSEYYVLTSGFNFTPANAKALKQAGLTGVVISLDHFDPEKHNVFRGSGSSFQEVMQAVRNAQEQNLVITLTVCVTRAFTTWENLLRYAELAKGLQVPFIQLLEPKALGHYAGLDVFLDAGHFSLLDKFYRTLNFSPAYSDYPIIVYHGYYQRRIGCFSAGNRMLYIDSAGFVNACPFCHTKTVNIKDAIRENVNVPAAVRDTGCQQYENA
ncbi:MAG: radical SAM protein [Chitinophagaceae bacterium]